MTPDDYDPLEAERRSREELRKRDGPIWYDIKQGLGVIFGLAGMAAFAIVIVGGVIFCIVALFPQLVGIAIFWIVVIAALVGFSHLRKLIARP
jgi:tetrahydromethanopterin S-methyltransferase subunit E